MRPILFLLVLIGACKSKTIPELLPEEYPDYITAYSQGYIDINETLFVQFSDHLKPLQDSFGHVQVVFNPEHLVGAEYNNHILKIVPLQPFAPGTSYEVSINLSAIFEGVEKNFSFKVETKRQYLSVAFEEYYFPQLSQTNTISLKGVVQVAVETDQQLVSKILSAHADGQPSIPVQWEEYAGNNTYRFTIENIVRKNGPYEVSLDWDGSVLGLTKESGSRKIAIPAEGEFYVLNYGISDPETQALKIQFSEPLAQNQDFTGLVNLEGTDVALRFQNDQNILLVYPSTPLKGSFSVRVDEQLKSAAGKPLGKRFGGKVDYESQHPGVRLAAKGHIMPIQGPITFPFEAVNLKLVDVEVYRIYQNNILQFLQVNGLGSNYELERVSKRISKKTIDLSDQVSSQDLSRWTRYQVNIQDEIKADPNGIYQVKISFRPQYALLSCGTLLSDDDDQSYDSPWDYPYYGPAGYYNNYWLDRDDPCKSAYYNEDKFIQQNILASDLGLMAKHGGDQAYMIVANNISDASPLQKVKLEFYDFALQSLGIAETDEQGVCQKDLPTTAAFVIASHGTDRNYLQLMEGYALPISKFDVGGETRQSGLRCFIFGERGVWRPGDSIFVHAIIDSEQDLPVNYPAKYKFQDPQGKLVSSGTVIKKTGHIYAISLVTTSNAPTGDWTLRFDIGGAQFQKRLKIESIKPNRLKLAYTNLDEEVMFSERLKLNLQANWLHGGAGSDLVTKVERRLRQRKTNFKNYPHYNFDDQTRILNLSNDPEVVFDGHTDDLGQANFEVPNEINEAAGKLEMELMTRVFERSGESSVMVSDVKFSPYKSYSGIAINGHQNTDDIYVALDQPLKIDLLNISENGQPLNNKQLKIGLYKINWYYWWESDAASNLLQYSTGDLASAAIYDELLTNAEGKVQYNYTPNDYGSYLIKVCDPESGHCTSKVIYVGNPWEDGDNQEAATMLSLKTDKTTYQVQDKVRLSIPALNDGKALITLEKGSQVVNYFWRDMHRGPNEIDFTLDEKMAPGGYISVSLLQGYATSSSDLPLRQYGIVPIQVEDPKRKLHPLILCPEESKPNHKIQLTVKEEEGRSMDYLVAIVDEGLLGLTAFKTPNPYLAFNDKEALQLATWDLYDQVFNLHPGEFGRLLAVGGDEEALLHNPEKVMRFEPVVRVLGPFSLPAGQKHNHEVEIKNYIGELRAMVIAARDGSYGHQEKAIKVNNPIMVLATLPRTLTPGAQMMVPVNVFTTKPRIGQIKISISDKANFAIIPNRQTTLTINKEGDEIVYFEMNVPQHEGRIDLLVEASSGAEIARQEIHLEVVNPNPMVRTSQDKTLSPKETVTLTVAAPGAMGTNDGILELSYLPPIQFKDRLNQLINYPYGCAEQQVSAAFPQLFLEDVSAASPAQLKAAQVNIQQVINNLASFQNSDGGFSLWPRQSTNDEWVTNYVGHFLLAAQQKGYQVPGHLLTGWSKIQKYLVKKWNPIVDKFQKPASAQGAMQVYRLYTLALQGAPDIGAMNRLIDASYLTNQCKWQLAAAYALIGKKSIAEKIIQKSTKQPDAPADWGDTYGSQIRDESIILEALYDLGKKEDALEVCKSLSAQLANKADLNTQAVGYALSVLGKIYKTYKGDQIAVRYRLKNGPWNKVETKQPIFITEWSADQLNTSEVEVQNEGGKPMFARWTVKGQPVSPKVSPINRSITTSVKYQDMEGNDIDISALKQGAEFKCMVTVQNTAKRVVKNLALQQAFPIGWEIVPMRLGSSFNTNPDFDYQDVRDDRVFTFFNLNSGARKTFTIRLTANYPGKFLLPALICEGMYDPEIQSVVPGQTVQVLN